MSLIVASETDEASFPWTDKKASDMQSNVTVSGNVISGDLNFIEGGLSPDGPLAGDGWFVALHWTDPDSTHGVTSLKVGLVPSATGMDLQECFSDTDRNGVFKITPELNQKFRAVQSNGTKQTTQDFKLNFNFLPAADADDDDEGV